MVEDWKAQNLYPYEGEAATQIERAKLGSIRLELPGERSFDNEEIALLRQAADRGALSIRRVQLHEEEHRIAVELQRGLIPARLPSVSGIELAAHYQAAGLGAEVGGDWYDAFVLPSGRLGVVLGDVAGSGIRAASTMGQLRSVTRAFALGNDEVPSPGEVLTRLAMAIDSSRCAPASTFARTPSSWPRTSPPPASALGR